jgi:hypothetical protein
MRAGRGVRRSRECTRGGGREHSGEDRGSDYGPPGQHRKSGQALIALDLGQPHPVRIAVVFSPFGHEVTSPWMKALSQ